MSESHKAEQLVKKLKKKADKKFKIFSRLKLNNNMEITEDYIVKQHFFIFGWNHVESKYAYVYFERRYDTLDMAKIKLEQIKSNYVVSQFRSLNLELKQFQRE
jgi:hypothetical protein